MTKVLFSLLVFICAEVSAQQPKFLFGLNATGVWSSYSFTKGIYPTSIKSSLNLSSGVQVKYSLNKKLSLDAQLNYSTKNIYYEKDFRAIDLSAGIVKYTVKQNYLEVPIAMNYFFKAEKPVSFFCSLGFTNSFFLSAKYDRYNSPVSAVEKYKPYLLSVKSGGGVLFACAQNLYCSAELYSTIYLDKVQSQDLVHGNPFQLALGFSVLKKFGLKTSSIN